MLWVYGHYKLSFNMDFKQIQIVTLKAVFHLALSNMAQRHVAFCERHVALHERHVALLECHVALHVRHVALLLSNIQTVKCLFTVFLCHIQPTQAIVTVKNTTVTDVSRSHL